jgi:hypothetical protein
MAVSNATLSDISGAASDLFAGEAAQATGALQAQGLRITAAGTRISAQSTRLSAEGLRIKSQGDLAEASNYDAAAVLAEQNSAFTAQSTRIQQAQSDRAVTMAIGGQRAAVAGAGFTQGGSAGDLLRDSAQQGALAHAVLGQQGVITQAGYDEQAKSFQTMAAAGRTTAAGEMDIAGKTDAIAGQQDIIAGQQDALAAQTQQAAEDAASNDDIMAGIKGVAAVASLFIV